VKKEDLNSCKLFRGVAVEELVNFERIGKVAISKFFESSIAMGDTLLE